MQCIKRSKHHTASRPKFNTKKKITVRHVVANHIVGTNVTAKSLPGAVLPVIVKNRPHFMEPEVSLTFSSYCI